MLHLIVLLVHVAANVEILSGDVPFRDNILNDEYKYYRYEASMEDIVRIQVESCSGDVNLYVIAEKEKQGFPTLSDFSFSSSRLGSSLDEITIFTPIGTYLIGVHSSSGPSTFELSVKTTAVDSSILSQRAKEQNRQLNLTEISHSTLKVSFNIIEAGTYKVYLFDPTTSFHLNTLCGVEMAKAVASSKKQIQPKELEAMNPSCSTQTSTIVYGQRSIRFTGLKAPFLQINLVFRPLEGEPVLYQLTETPMEPVSTLPVYYIAEGTISRGSYHYARVPAPDPGIQSVKVQLEVITGDTDIYLHSRTLPTFDQYEYVSNLPGNDQLILTQPFASVYFIGIYGAEDDSTYRLLIQDVDHLGVVETPDVSEDQDDEDGPGFGMLLLKLLLEAL